ncbi:MAG TPA: bifunctional oligoribonuclease/PAP phosphatase NrnA [bacterium]|nr:bifunctional oligoribonuclease/PAP phosphatase NrnA [bacterium]
MKLKTKPAKKAPRAGGKFSDVVRLIKSKKSFLLTTHVSPDGDGLGAQSALYVALKKLGKKVLVVNHDPLPRRFSYLPFTADYRVSDNIPPHDVCFVLDAGSFSRIRDGVKRSEFGTLVNIDHHYSNDKYGDFNLVMPDAAATGEIVYQLIQAMKVKIDQGIAESVYTSIITDTGRFRYSNTNSHIFRMAAELLEAGADGSKVSESVFGDVTREAMELTHLALGTIQTFNEGKIGTMTLTMSDFKKSGALDEDTDNLINLVRNLDTVKIAIFLKEVPGGQVKISLRSKNKVNVADVAKLFGGGGHAYAAGAVMPGPLQDAFQKVLTACQATLK